MLPLYHTSNLLIHRLHSVFTPFPGLSYRGAKKTIDATSRNCNISPFVRRTSAKSRMDVCKTRISYGSRVDDESRLLVHKSVNLLTPPLRSWKPASPLDALNRISPFSCNAWLDCIHVVFTFCCCCCHFVSLLFVRLV